MLPCLLHTALAIHFFFPHKAKGMQVEKAGILRAAVSHAPIHPGDAGLHILKHRIVFRAMENFAPNAFHRSGDELGFGIEVVVDRAYRNPAGGCNRANADGRPPLLWGKIIIFYDFILFYE